MQLNNGQSLITQQHIMIGQIEMAKGTLSIKPCKAPNAALTVKSPPCSMNWGMTLLARKTKRH
jgi:hypothetical protein